MLESAAASILTPATVSISTALESISGVPDESISIPPALALICTAFVPVPADDNFNCCVPPPTTAISKS